jgi:antitoxin component YwqK of YwqJK toxin-antitoxin module
MVLHGFSVAFLIAALISAPLFSQNINDGLAAPPDSSITLFDKYNPVLGGDSVRIVNGIEITGQYKDYYPQGGLSHSGVYQNGRLIYYKNYFPNGQVERFFSAKGSQKHRLKVFYPNGVIRSDVTFYKGKSLLWIDYYPNGQLELYEEYHKGLQYYLQLKFYTEEGKSVSELVIIDKRKLLYSSKQYHPNGVLAEEGTRMYNKWVGDYQKHGCWKYYNESGSLISTENYVKGNLVGE